MSTVKTHLSKFHAEAEAIHTKHEAKSRESGDEVAAAYHADMKECHRTMGEECAGSDASKAAGSDDADKVAVQTVSLAQMEEFRQGLHKLGQFAELFGNQIRPDGVRSVIPNNPNAVKVQAVTRSGQPEMKDIPIEFADLLKIDG